ncbi:MAG TPA: hypothetical protein EYP41_20595 [Anaerolineae bacterium]|nr:hypothetical protein [Anaerolineae bacterium]HIP70923.1 hypothetical protein [Anaerolineae bacterium]
MSDSESSICLHPNGYIEVIFRGVVRSSRLAELIEEAQRLSEKYSSINVLIDGRNGATSRTARSFSTMMRMGRFPNVTQLIILTTDDPARIDAIRGPGVVTSILTSALGFRPIYTSDEAEARRLAAKK